MKTDEEEHRIKIMDSRRIITCKVKIEWWFGEGMYIVYCAQG